MPSRFTVKPYVAQGGYHVFNRGVNKSLIYQDEQDVRTFLRLLRTGVMPPTKEGYRRANFTGEIAIVAYTVMPNHFHLLLQQKQDRSLPAFMRSIVTSYVRYFNAKYDRVGHLFQGPYKARLLEFEQDYTRTIEYIHSNAYELKTSPWWRGDYSSESSYINAEYPAWLTPVNEII